ncbi:hypothetical protein CCACVL1_07243, partial [Corchorus capsularis]
VMHEISLTKKETASFPIVI